MHMSDADRNKTCFSVFGPSDPASLITPTTPQCSSSFLPASSLSALSFFLLLNVHPDKSLKCHRLKNHEDWYVKLQVMDDIWFLYKIKVPFHVSNNLRQAQAAHAARNWYVL